MVSLTTVTTGRDYAPRNVGAVWVASSSGAFVKTLEQWGNRRASHLVKWIAATNAAGLSRNTVDAVTAATARAHGTHKSAWNCTDTREAAVPAGNYQLCMEMTESNPPPTQYNCVPFKHAGAAWQLTPPSTTNFKSIALTYAPP